MLNLIIKFIFVPAPTTEIIIAISTLLPLMAYIIYLKSRGFRRNEVAARSKS